MLNRTHMFSRLIVIILVSILLSGCNSNSTSGLLMIDLSKRYPNKSLSIQDIADVEYITLETREDYLFTTISYLDNERIIAQNLLNGDIIFFSRDGKIIKKINRYGNGGEEYDQGIYIFFDRKREELFVYSIMRKKILVYDGDGKFKRDFIFKDIAIDAMFSFDDTYFLCHDRNRFSSHLYLLISKDDGSIVTSYFEADVKEKQSMLILPNGPGARSFPIIKWGKSFFLNEMSLDTIYKTDATGLPKPFMVRTPSALSMSVPVYLFALGETERYVFLLSRAKIYDEYDKSKQFPSKNLIYDKLEKAIYTCTFYNEDMPDIKITIPDVMFPDGYLQLKIYSSSEYFSRMIPADQIVEQFSKSKLKGELKEIASTLQIDDNPVLMLVKMK
ncbi:MAG: 6-bladed beta-propeller [Firmicutes bacterium]|nr:6-bladed beta-propeller [Bacillota bacterium]